MAAGCVKGFGKLAIKDPETRQPFGAIFGNQKRNDSMSPESVTPQNAFSGAILIVDRYQGTVPFAGLLLNLRAGRMENNPSTERVDER